MAADGHLNFDTKLDESGFQSGIGKLGSIAKGGLSILGGAIAGVTSAIGAGSAAAIKVGADFEAGMSKVSAISGATGSELQALSDKAKEMGAETKFSATESAEAFQYMAMAGWKTGDMLDGIEGVMNLAAASGEDLATTSDIVTDALTAMGLQAADSAHFADVLAAASSSSNTNVSLMGETFKYAAPLAGALGYNIEDLSQAIGLMANAGIKGAQSGTSLRSILTRLAKPPKEAAEAMEKYNISMKNSDGSMKSLMQVMENMRDSLQGLPEDEQAAAAAAIGGQEAMSGLLAIVNASEEDFDKLSTAIDNADGSAAEMAETMNDNLPGAIALFRSAAEGLGIELYESVENPLKDIVKTGTDSIDQLTEAFKEDGATGAIEAGGEIVANLLTGLTSATPKVLGISIQIIRAIVQSLVTNMPQIAIAGGQIITVLGQGIVELLPVLGVLAYTLLTTFLNGIISHGPEALTAGTQMLTSVLDGVSSKLPELIPLAISAILAFAQGLVNNLPTIADAGLNMLVALAEGIANSLPTLIEQVPKLINEFCENIDNLLPQILMTGIQIIVALGKGLIQSIPTIIANAGEIVAAIINVIMHLNLFNTGKGIIQGLGKGLKSMLGSIGSIAKSIIEAIKNPFSINWGSIGENIAKGIANGLKGAASAIVDAAKSAASKALEAAKSFLGIHSPSRVFRDQVGKMMALGMGIGFERNIPVKSMSTGVQRAVSGLQKSVDLALSARTSDKSVGGVKSISGYGEGKDIDYDRLEKIQMRAAEKLAKRPIFLDKKRIDTPLPEGAIPVW